MNGIGGDFRGRKRYTLGVPRDAAARLMDEWLYRNMPCNMHVGRAKTKGLMFVRVDADLEKDDPNGIYFLSWIVQNCGEVKVDVQDLK